jgi:hypothetical protein
MDGALAFFVVSLCVPHFATAFLVKNWNGFIRLNLGNNRNHPMLYLDAHVMVRREMAGE